MKNNLNLLILIFLLLFCNVNILYAKEFQKNIKVNNINYQTKDNYILKGKFYYKKTFDKQKQYPLIILLHSLGHSKYDWGNLPQTLAENNFFVLSIDLRGHGESNKNAEGKILGWQSFSKNAFLKYPNDISEVINYFLKKYPKNLNKNKIIFIGADIGANTAILSAYESKIKPQGMVLISPSINFKGLYIPIKLANLGNVPILGIASVNDKFSINGLKETNRYSQGAFTMKICQKGSMGMSILKTQPELKNIILNWCKSL